MAAKQQEGINKLWLVIKTFMFVSITLIIFDIVGFIFTDDITGRIIKDPTWANDLIVCFVRTLAYIAWAFPLFYLFWPNIISRTRRNEYNSTRSLNKRTIAGHTVPSGFISKDISGYWEDDYEGNTTPTNGAANGSMRSRLLKENSSGSHSRQHIGAVGAVAST